VAQQRETKNNSGVLFKNDKRTTDKHPNMKGRACIDGVMYWVSAWTNEPQGGGDRYQSLSFEPMENQPQRQEQAARSGNHQMAGGAGANFRVPPRRENPPPADPFGGPGVPESDIPFAPNTL